MGTSGTGSERPCWVVFDYGEVISKPTSALPRITAELGMDGAALHSVSAAYFAEREAYDRGCDDHEYWSAVAARLGTSVDERLSRELTRLDVAGWSETDPGTLLLLRELTASGTPLALLSNAPGSFAREAERTRWAEHFHQVVFSADLGMAKPDEEIWRVLLERIDASPERCLFFDDREPNVAAARAAGLHARRWQGPEHAREVLRSRGVLPAANDD
ncbi:putative hydrolase of the HAD superfamily [Actinopolyspora mzabensis]|uniref:Putative hydrolase of the HAD superfamily n=1 Tax=Actinopolyspora mzabensis TaxID=995066 RepID=A0A1G8XBJ1_ACTMZ|nr:HAD-IA family hydrolase [Actinopolyspora mzabensis]SDJ87120.1 putative hydrolase of the HAD superfamily [Actinopolyspora mzabensis]